MKPGEIGSTSYQGLTWKTGCLPSPTNCVCTLRFGSIDCAGLTFREYRATSATVFCDLGSLVRNPREYGAGR
jgi:hypothetical protein